MHEIGRKHYFYHFFVFTENIMKSILTLLVLMIGLSSYAASSAYPPDSTTTFIEKGTAKYFISEGKRLYNEGDYRMSLVKFREALTKDAGNAEATYWLAECHLALGNYEKAQEYVEEALAKNPSVSPEANNVLAICQHRTGQLDLAIENYKKALGILSENRAKLLEVQFHIEQCERAKEMMKSPIKVAITRMPITINTAFEETAPTLSPDGKTFYFVSRRADNKGGGISPGDQRYYEDIYVSVWDETKKAWGEASNSSDLLNRVNTNGMDAVSHISADGQTLYMTINTMILKSPKPKTRHSDIFYCKMNRKGTWNSPKAIGKPINSVFFDAAVSLTADESTAYFISERSGEKKQSDIYVSYRSGNTWGKPENLGDSINSTGNETTVFVSPDGIYLFFSSTGHEGMGGYDIFVSKNDGNEWGKPVNLGYPINTVSDETHFVYYSNLKRAYYSTFSSVENKGMGARDLFEVDMTNFILP